MGSEVISHTPPEQLIPQTTVQRLENYAYTLIDEVQSPLVKLQTELFNQVEDMTSQKFGVPRFKFEETETDYWRVTDKVQSLEEKIKEITDTLDKFETGDANENDLKALLPQEEIEPEKISKRKQAIAREEERLQRLGIDLREIAFERHIANFGADGYRFTTGKHQKRVSGNMDTYSAEGVFYNRTIDTHGGKADYGKRGNFYTSSSGKRIRKK